MILTCNYILNIQQTFGTERTIIIIIIITLFSLTTKNIKKNYKDNQWVIAF